MARRFISLALLLISPLAGLAMPPQTRTPPTVAEQYLFSAANAERTQRGLQPLRWNADLQRAAGEHARMMAARGAISHRFQGEPDLSTRGKQAGAQFNVISENVAEAPDAVQIHSAWMHSPGHRANLLDPRVDSIGIGVISRAGELYAVEDFDRSFGNLSLRDQEAAVESMLQATSSVSVLASSGDARRTCAMATGYAGSRMPWFVMRYTAADLTQLPEELRRKLGSGKYHHAEVGACKATGTSNFSAYSIAVLLFP